MVLKRTQPQQTPEQKSRERAERKFIVGMILGEGATIEQIERLFASMDDNIQREISAYFGRYSDGDTGTANNWQDRADKAEIDRLKRMIDDSLKDDETSRTEPLTEEARREMENIQTPDNINRVTLLQAFVAIEIIRTFDKFHKLMVLELTKRVVEENTRQERMWGRSVGKVFTPKQIDDIVTDSFVNARWSETVWGLHQDELRTETERLIRRGVINGENPKKLAKELRDKINTSKHFSERLMRTEERRVQTLAQLEAYKAQGFSQYLYIAEPDACKICAALDNGEPMNLSQAKRWENIPPVHPNCRCSTTPYMTL